MTSEFKTVSRGCIIGEGLKPIIKALLSGDTSELKIFDPKDQEQFITLEDVKNLEERYEARGKAINDLLAKIQEINIITEEAPTDEHAMGKSLDGISFLCPTIADWKIWLTQLKEALK
jgi:hypothetical protein